MSIISGYLYILSHPSDSKLIKVGVTKREPYKRLKEHNSNLKAQAGKIVEKTGIKWQIKAVFPVPDIYMAESAFFNRYPLDCLPSGKSEVFQIDDIFTQKWIDDGIRLATEVGIRHNKDQSPIPRKEPKRGKKWLEEQLSRAGLIAVNSYGNGLTKVWFECGNDHKFKIDGLTLSRYLKCPICFPDIYERRDFVRVELDDGVF